MFNLTGIPRYACKLQTSRRKCSKKRDTVLFKIRSDGLSDFVTTVRYSPDDYGKVYRHVLWEGDYTKPPGLEYICMKNVGCRRRLP